MKQLVQKFRTLSEREQRLLVIAAVVTVIGLFYFLIWSPMSQSIERNQAAVQSQRELLAWVQKNANKAIQLKGSQQPAQAFSGSLTQTVNQQAERNGISISRMQPQGDELLVWVDEVPFNQVLTWLQTMEQQGIRILDADFSESSVPGQIKVRRLQLGKS